MTTHASDTRILIVDDAPHSLFAAERALRSSYAVVTATDATTAEQRWREQAPDLVLLDVNLPDASGVELSHAWKNNPDRRGVPIILRSSVSVSAAEQALGLESGADGYLIEPVDPEVLHATVDAHLRIRDLIGSLHAATTYARELVDYGVALAEAASPSDVLALVVDFGGTLLDIAGLEVRWTDIRSDRPRRFRSLVGPASDHLTALLDTEPTDVTFYPDRAQLPDVGVDPPEDHEAWAVMPFRVAETRGVLAVACAQGCGLDVIQRRYFQTFVGLTAISLARTASAALTRSIATTLQEALLPAPDVLDDVEVARELIVAAKSSLAGGDWFDGYVLPTGCQLLVVGDMVGHGAEAAAASSVFRHTLRTLALTGHRVDDALPTLDRLLDGHPQKPSGTLLALEIDPGTGEIAVWSCGHPAPFYGGAGRPWRQMDIVPAAPLGYGLVTEPVEPVILHLDEADTLVAFTDGVVERRSGDIDDGLERLRATLPEPGPPDGIVSTIIASPLLHDLDDDALVMAFRVRTDH